MTKIDLELEKHFKTVGSRPQRKNEETLTSFDRDIFWYDKDTKHRQTPSTTKVTYEHHRKAIETAVNFMRKDTQHTIAMCILTHRHFEDYRNSVFSGEGNFTADYSFIVKKVHMLFNPTTSRITTSSISTKLKEFTTPTLVQVNHVVGEVTPVTVPDTGETLNEWAIKFNENANETTTYHVAGLKIGA